MTYPGASPESPATVTSAAAGPRPAVRDGFFDSVKALALWRVVIWHALAWPWLSWFAAMPAMFYVAGVLLARSLDRHGYRATLASRLRRLLVPFWAYGTMAVGVMVLAGWRPSLRDLLWWVVPVGDPEGLATTPGLWVPLWYLRAYLWMVLVGPVLVWMARRWGHLALLAPTGATLAVWWWQQNQGDVALAWADAALFPFFVLAGMLTAYRDGGSPRAFAVGAGVLGVAALAWNAIFETPQGIVNSSLPLHLLAGSVTIAALLALRPVLAHPAPPVAGFVTWSGRRALTIYLWHGLGLLVADRTVHATGWPLPLKTGVGLAVVVLVTVAATALVGWVEDVAAQRPRAASSRPALVALLPALALLVAATQVEVDGRAPRVVPSGEMVLARGSAAEITAVPDLSLGTDEMGASPGTLSEPLLQAALADWLVANDGLLRDLGTDLIEVAMVDHTDRPVVLQWTRDGQPVELEAFPWWSMSKTMTAAWMMQLADEGVIRLDEPLVDHLVAVPYAEAFTFEQLAGHRSGLPSAIDHDTLSASPLDEIGAWFDEAELSYAPGEGFDYSRVGYHILTWGLEEASGSQWRTAMESMATAAGAVISIDEDYAWVDRNTHPGSGDYRGALWGAGGLYGTIIDGARLLRWTLVEWLDPNTVQQMVVAPATGLATAGEGVAYYGLGTMPFCPCQSDGDHLWSNRVGLSTVTGAYVVDLNTGVGLMFRTDSWWHSDRAALEFDDLLRDLLDSVVTAPVE